MSQRNITEDDVEEVFYGRHLKRKTGEGRYLIFGRTADGRYLLIVIVDDQIITAREMTNAERQMFKKKGHK